MKNKVLLFFALVVLCCSSAWAQIQIKGTVVSENDSEPMIGVAILEVGTSNGVITDLDGNFNIQVKNENSQLEVSFVGYKKQIIKLQGRTNLNVRLVEDTKVLDEVVVVRSKSVV